MSYHYKIQWYLREKEAYKLINLLRARSFDKINLRDLDDKIVDTYDCSNLFTTTQETIKYIKKKFKENKGVYWVEVIRK